MLSPEKAWGVCLRVHAEYISELNREVTKLEARGWPQPETEAVRNKLLALQELKQRELAAVEKAQSESMLAGLEAAAEAFKRS